MTCVQAIDTRYAARRTTLGCFLAVRKQRTGFPQRRPVGRAGVVGPDVSVLGDDALREPLFELRARYGGLLLAAVVDEVEERAADRNPAAARSRDLRSGDLRSGYLRSGDLIDLRS